MRRAWVPSYDEAIKKLDEIVLRRRRRGYHPIDTD
jgi:hypothetical protein